MDHAALAVTAVVPTDMISVFLCGPLCDDRLRRAVLGADPAARAAALPGYALLATAGGDACAVARADAQISGLMVDLEPGPAARLAYYMQATGQQARSGDVMGVRVTFYGAEVETGLPEWCLAEWQGRWGALDRMAAVEIIAARGRIAEEDMQPRRAMIRARAAARLAAQGGVPSDLRSDQSADSVDLRACENVHDGFFVTRAMELRHPRFDGQISAQMRREVFVATDAAIVLPYDPRRDRVMLVEQFRMGPYGRGDPKPWMLEPIAGRVDGGEDPARTARRECAEEAGLVLRDLLHISSHYCSPGCSTEYFHCYLGLCDLPDLVQGAGGLDSEQEDIRTHVIRFDAAMALLDSGEADNGPLVLSLLWLARQRDRLRAAA